MIKFESNSMGNYLILKPDLYKLIDGLIQKGTEIIAPVKQENFTNFYPIKSAREIVLGAPQTVIPPKQFLYPQSEELLAYEFGGQSPKLNGINQIKQRILLGIHPCDLNAIFEMDQVFAEKNQDENYLEKRKAVTIIGVDCQKPCSPESICSRMGGLDPKGRFDLFLTDIGSLFFVEVITEKGEALLGDKFKEAKKTDLIKLKNVRKKRDLLFNKEQKKLLPKLKNLPELMKGNYNHIEWEERGKKCYGCGSCNMVCPTCYCFDVQDYMHISLVKGARNRFWDGCMLEEFAKVASGENFRENRLERLRHRTDRKLYYLFEKWGESFCTGCGRCIKACLTDIVSPLEIANALYGMGKK
jgi:ferredoxin